ncbi:Ferric-pseudobactin M114 receptor pbuA [Fibrisoma limi BUZ 3]|uniref:Ferric-pseudobactin M114 receptor pbuA n=1 Tax=Fibrisoma limi BUZ 3 TaxID=1185876 RepID=I2GBG7_9BACT|nr:TonB-dependent receptor [Fibrisoma limi]CCH51241.1 Ferric-pseudobactin M114 receptor pbuA [Fibrisoma limi BUZ 3]
MRYVYLLHLLLLTSLSSFAITPDDDKPRATVRGSILTADSQPAEYVTVVLTDSRSGKKRYGMLTDPRGQFTIKVPAGMYTLTATVVGYENKAIEVEAEAGQTIQVPAIILNETAKQLQEVVVSTQRVGAYTEKISEIGTRMPGRLRDVPQSIQVIGRQILQDRQVQTVGEAVKSMVGINAFSSTQYSDYVLRGFRSTPGNFAYNGIRGDFYAFDQAALTYNIERIEAVKGPASVLFSAGNPGGVINHVTKRAQAAPRYEVQATVGSFDQYRFMGDATGAVTKSQKLLYRLVVGYEKTGQLDRNQTIRNVFLAPQLQYNFSDRTSLNYELNYARDRRTMGFQRGVPALSTGEGKWQLDRYPRNFSMIDPNAYSHVSSLSNQLIFTHRFNDRVKLTTLARSFINPKYEQFDVSPGNFNIGAVNDSITFDHRYFDQINNRQYQLSTFVSAEVQTGPLRHSIIVGADANSSGRTYNYASLSSRRLSLYNLDFSWASYQWTPATIAAAEYQSRVDEQTNLFGAYVQDQLSIGERWKVLLGGRFELHRYRSTTDDIVGDTAVGSDKLRASRFIPRIGVVYQPNQRTSLYGSYTEGFQPQYGSNLAAGGPFPPEGSRQIEVGMKNDWLAGRLTTSIAAYYIKKTDVLTPDPSDPEGIRLLQTDAVYSKGIEVSAQGNLNDNISLIANYAYNEARTPGDAGFDFNAAGWFPNAPNHNVNLWATYRLTQGALAGLKFGAGFNHLSKRATFVPGFEIPGYTTVDASVSYERKGFNVNLGLFNLTDETYYYGVYGPANLWPGNPRSFRLTVGKVF